MALSKIGTDAIADDAINADKIASNTVVASDIADGTITHSKIANSNIQSKHLEDNIVLPGNDSITVPTGNTGQRGSAVTGKLRFNTEDSSFEGYNGSAWSSVGGGATGGGSDQVFHLNDQVVSTNYTIPNDKNAMSAGPIEISNNVTVTVSNNAVWTVI